MPKRDAAPIGAPCWVDVFTSDPGKTRAFYGQLFGWTSEAAGDEYGGYINFQKDGILVAGGVPNDGTSGTLMCGRCTSRPPTPRPPSTRPSRTAVK